MKRKVQLVLLCEDQQQEAFLRRFLQGTGWSNRMFPLCQHNVRHLSL